MRSVGTLMPDLAKCSGEFCSIRERCYRFTVSPSDYRQSWLRLTRAEQGEGCREFLYVPREPSKRMPLDEDAV